MGDIMEKARRGPLLPPLGPKETEAERLIVCMVSAQAEAMFRCRRDSAEWGSR